MTWSGPVRQFTVAIDFDGTLITDAWPLEGYDMPGGAETISWLLEEGARVIIWTCRTERPCPPDAAHSDLSYVRKWLEKHGLLYAFGKSILVNENYPDVLEKFGHVESRKVFAHVYVDDKNLGGFPGWLDARVHLDGHMREFEERIAAYVS